VLISEVDVANIKINQANIRYEILGDQGPWIVLTPGGRGPLENVKVLGETLCQQGYRVLLHDRRNCGYSDVIIEGHQSEQEIWAEDLAALLSALEIRSVIAGGGSAGFRLSLLLALRNPGLVRGLILWHVTGGRHAATVLGESYYGQFITMANDGGMKSVCESEFFAERIQQNPSNKDRLLAMDVRDFVEVMDRWRSFFDEGADLPVIGATEETLRELKIPTCIVPGSDQIHPREVAVNLSKLLHNAELHYPFDTQERAFLKDQSLEVIVAKHTRKLGGIYSAFLSGLPN
jgi:pimeloyl-ACP methyl ester carboxylesterase